MVGGVKNTFIRYLLAALFSAALTMGCVWFFFYCERSAFFWLMLIGSILLLLAVCISFSVRDDLKVRKPLEDLSLHLEKHKEKFAFQPLLESKNPSIMRLSQNIRGLCNQLIITKMKMKNQQKQLEFIFSNMNEGFLMTDLDRKIIFLNGTASQILGMGMNAIRHKIDEVIDDRDILESIDKAIGRNKVTSFDLAAANGNIYSLTTKLIRNPNFNEKDCIMIALFDVTAERAALRQRQDFFSNASHELKTPITSISGFAELLETGLVTDPQKAADGVKIIRREAKRMTDIIDDLLFISKLENNGEQAPATSIHMEELLLEMKEAMAPMMMEKNISLEISGGAFTIFASDTHMHNLFGNLIQNAVKYNVENGSVWVRVEKDDRYLYLTVKDTGIGIPEDMKARVFERFFRVDKGRSRNIGGTGLGLAIVKHIVSLYDGTITLDSVLGKGTTIFAKLKIAFMGNAVETKKSNSSV
ncbi:MAG: ATP-binding protein, partial [Oscillospiraceae bacterium]